MRRHECEDTSPRLTYVLGGAGLVALGGFVFFEAKGQLDYADAKSGCGASRTCSSSEVDSLRTQFITAGACLVTSAVLLGAATAIALVAPTSSRKP